MQSADSGQSTRPVVIVGNITVVGQVSRSRCEVRIAPGILKSSGKEIVMLESGTLVQIVAGVLALAVLGIIIVRRKQKAV